MTKALSWRTGLGMILMMALWVVSNGQKDPGIATGIPPSTVADYLHTVIEADRTFYTVHVVERLQIKGILVASQNWRAANTLPLPAQFLIESGELAAKTGSKVTYRLIGLWPINKANGPATEFERRGLEDVLMHPERPYTHSVARDREQYFEAVYADRAVTQACIGCHNAHPESPKRDFQMNDVMGGIVITIPLGHESSSRME